MPLIRDLTEHVWLQRPITSVDEQGGHASTWEAIQTIWAKIEDARTPGFNPFSPTQSTLFSQVFIRPHPQVLLGCRFMTLDAKKTYLIVGITENKNTWTCRCQKEMEI